MAGERACRPFSTPVCPSKRAIARDARPAVTAAAADLWHRTLNREKALYGYVAVPVLAKKGKKRRVDCVR